MFEVMKKTEDICATLLREVGAQANPEFVRYAAEHLGINAENYYGLRTQAIYRIADMNYQHIAKMGIEARFDICERLLDSGIKDLKYIAFRWAYRFRKEYEARHIDIMYRWLNFYVRDWADCDFLATRVIGEYLLLFPQQMGQMIQWAKSPNKWMRRGAAVSLCLPVSQKGYFPFVFTLARLLITDSEEHVTKACASLLCVAAERNRAEVLRFVQNNKNVMDGKLVKCLESEVHQRISEPAL